MRMMKAFGLLERNLGLAIAYLEYPGESERAYPKLAKLSFDNMIDRLDRLLSDEPDRANEQRSADFAEWRTYADTARRIRNEFVHGHLACLPLDTSTPIHLERPAWHASGGRALRMSLEDLEEKVLYIERASDRFRKFRQKHII